MRTLEKPAESPSAAPAVNPTSDAQATAAEAPRSRLSAAMVLAHKRKREAGLSWKGSRKVKAKPRANKAKPTATRGPRRKRRGQTKAEVEAFRERIRPLIAEHSAREIAAILGEPVATVGYHLTILRRQVASGGKALTRVSRGPGRPRAVVADAVEGEYLPPSARLREAFEELAKANRANHRRAEAEGRRQLNEAETRVNLAALLALGPDPMLNAEDGEEDD